MRAGYHRRRRYQKACTVRSFRACRSARDGERRLEAGLALLPFQTLDQRRLLPTDVRAGAAVQVDVKVVAGPGYILGGVYKTIFSNL